MSRCWNPGGKEGGREGKAEKMGAGSRGNGKTFYDIVYLYILKQRIALLARSDWLLKLGNLPPSICARKL